MTGLGKIDRERLSAVLRAGKGVIAVSDAAEVLGMPNAVAAKLLARWAKKGWLSRVRRGLYVSVPLESKAADMPMEDPWIVAAEIYRPCYIGGWSAAEYWDLTEQIFRTVTVMTTQRPKQRNAELQGAKFMLRTVPDKAMFGLSTVWRGQAKVRVSDPARTILDILDNPLSGGGLRSSVDMFRNYLRAECQDLRTLVRYGDELGNGAVFKRLGFLLEKYAGGEQDALELCRERLTSGNAKLDPAAKTNKLATRWRLWVPEKWLKENCHD